MDATVISKTRLPSRRVTVGPQRAPHRSYLYAMGLNEQDQRLVCVASCWNEAAPCNSSLLRQGAPVGQARRASSSGTPRELRTIRFTESSHGHQGMKSSWVSLK